jgi:hypothetical protein
MVWFGVTILIGSEISSCKAEPDVVFQGLHTVDAQLMADSGIDGSFSGDGSLSGPTTTGPTTTYRSTCADDDQLLAKEDVCEIKNVDRVNRGRILGSKDSCPSIYANWPYNESDAAADDQTTQCPQICALIKNGDQSVSLIWVLDRYYYYDDPSNPTKLIACPLLCEWLRGCWEITADESAQPSSDAAI